MKILLPLLLSLSLFGLDLGYDTDSIEEQSQSKNMSNSRDQDVSGNTSNSRTKTKNTETSESLSKSLSKDVKVKFLAELIALEKAGVEPFASCSLLNKPKSLKDFDLSCDVGFGMNSGMCNYFNEAAKNYKNLNEVIDSEYVINMKLYINCGAYYGAVIGQALKTGEVDFEIKDEEIKKFFLLVQDNLVDSDCRFAGALTDITCGSVVINYLNIPVIKFAGVEIFGGNKYYGYNLNLTKDKRTQDSLQISLAKSSSKSLSVKRSKSMKQDMSLTSRISSKATASLSTGKFVN